MKLPFFKFIGAGLLGLLVSAVAASEKLNIVVIIADDK